MTRRTYEKPVLVKREALPVSAAGNGATGKP
jgi:hypothetical protein